ncbi:unnamed protein product [Adineta steineri]|uniref:Uncharacterized protein n=1 Tax=Adineta steineri TaxID=433720 RepID=A0A815Z540_9BILA|nr:unnamed protein product [Adineta steineri]CAF1578760.1 unnamed protein product [Adineta steineri]
MIDTSNNNNSHQRHHLTRRKRRVAQRQQLTTSLLSSNDLHTSSILNTELNSNHKKIYIREQPKEYISLKNPLAWTKRWTKWFSPCGSQRSSRNDLNLATISVEKRSRTKSENDISKRGSIDQNEKKKLPTTNSGYTIDQNSNENQDEPRYKTSFHHQSNEKVNNINPVVYRNNTRRYSNTFFNSARYGGPRTSIAVIPSSTTINTLQQKQPSHLSRSVDRLSNNKSSRRELRYEEHDDYIPPLNSIQCHPTLDHYAKNLNQPTYFTSNHRRSQIETYQLSSINNRLVLPRPYSSNIPISYSLQAMPKTVADNNNNKNKNNNNNNNTYGKLSECHSPLTPLENSSVKAPRRIESAYSQFPVQEPVYANTQSLYDNILYPQTTSKVLNKIGEQQKKSCASQTQLTWTMATFSSFVDLENQSIIIPQPDPNTLYSVVQHYQSPLTRSASSELIEPPTRISSDARYIDDTNPSNHYQRPRSPTSSNVITVEKRDGSFQTHLSIAPTQDIESNKHLFIHDSTPSPLSTSSTTGGGTTSGQPKSHHHHHHHHHRKHKSRSNGGSGHISTRDVGLQVNIQTVKKITIIPQRSDESSLATTTTASSPSLMKTSRELKNVETNTEPIATKRDTSTSYDSSIRLVTSSSQTIDSSSPSTSMNFQTKAAQTPNKTLRDQSIETNNRGLFVCDLSSLLKGSQDDSQSSSTSSSLTTKRKS